MVSRKDVVFVFGALFWLYFSYANVFLNGWITFFVKMYNVVVNGILDKIGNVNGLQVDEVSDAYDVLIELVTFFNESMGFRVLVEVTVNICWTLGCTYFGWVYWKIGEYGGTVTNLLAAYLAIHTLYIYGNEAENLEQSRMKLVTKLSQIKIHGLNDVESKKVVCLTQKVINCKLLISPGNFFTLNRSFVLSILSVLMTVLIVMAQFRDSDELNGGNKRIPGDWSGNDEMRTCDCCNSTSLLQ